MTSSTNNGSDDFASLTTSTGGTFMRFADPGDLVDGVVARFTIDGGRDYSGEPCPEIVLDPCVQKGDSHTVELTGEQAKVVTCGQANLRRQVVENSSRFAVGHRVRIQFTGEAEASNGRTFKTFDVKATTTPVTVVGGSEPERTPPVDDELDF